MGYNVSVVWHSHHFLCIRLSIEWLATLASGGPVSGAVSSAASSGAAAESVAPPLMEPPLPGLTKCGREVTIMLPIQRMLLGTQFGVVAWFGHCFRSLGLLHNSCICKYIYKQFLHHLPMAPPIFYRAPVAPTSFSLVYRACVPRTAHAYRLGSQHVFKPF
jgi:hypothetical protein